MGLVPSSSHCGSIQQPPVFRCLQAGCLNPWLTSRLTGRSGPIQGEILHAWGRLRIHPGWSIRGVLHLNENARRDHIVVSRQIRLNLDLKPDELVRIESLYNVNPLTKVFIQVTNEDNEHEKMEYSKLQSRSPGHLVSGSSRCVRQNLN